MKKHVHYNPYSLVRSKIGRKTLGKRILTKWTKGGPIGHTKICATKKSPVQGCLNLKQIVMLDYILYAQNLNKNWLKHKGGLIMMVDEDQ